MAKKILIVGGVAGGASAAARLRRLDEQAEIIMFERGEYISYANCGLPYHIGGSIKERSKLLVQTPAAMKARFRIDVRTSSEVTAVDPSAKVVTVHSADRGVYQESYDALILSPGARPVKPPIPGINRESIYSLRTIPDMDRIKEVVERHDSKRAVIIGGGFIGVEMAENLRERGLEVVLVEAGTQILSVFDAEMAAYGEQELITHGVEVVTGDGVRAFHQQGQGIEVELESGRTVACDLVVLAIGVQPDTAFLQPSGIELGPRGHIIVNEHMQTSMADIYAVGDAVETTNLAGERAAVPLAGPANKQGRIAADHLCGLDSAYKGTQGTAVLRIFGQTGAATGQNERLLKKLGLPYHAIHLHPASHAGYYPGASPISLKLLFDETGNILGAQAFGSDGVDKRIDVIATVQRLSGTVYDLAELELCYAPPYSSAKDPVNMAGYVAGNVLSGRMKVSTDGEWAGREDAVLLDVRTDTEYAAGHLEGALHIPVDELRDRMGELDASKELYVYCAVGIRGYIACRILAQHGFTAYNVTGGYRTSKMNGRFHS
ncbi:FAD-dependent oxidoreductase [Paenibacillus sp. SYP-B4298]|uniref:FAD-dependent oxidoreductase n=1 Tax=Paenibacillus sp. SYP-B4298 TaxID=2996034 RepID=UPI0022DD6595|nr:FAD-dependent oxidoreductase [Paenibacillus sp. SYP-B4298]